MDDYNSIRLQRQLTNISNKFVPTSRRSSAVSRHSDFGSVFNRFSLTSNTFKLDNLKIEEKIESYIDR